jgi:hypothetical protein
MIRTLEARLGAMQPNDLQAVDSRQAASYGPAPLAW